LLMKMLEKLKKNVKNIFTFFNLKINKRFYIYAENEKNAIG